MFMELLHCQQQQQQQQPFYGPLSGTTRVSWYQKKHSPTHHADYHPIFISFFHLPRSIASFLFKLRAWQSFCHNMLELLSSGNIKGDMQRFFTKLMKSSF